MDHLVGTSDQALRRSDLPIRPALCSSDPGCLSIPLDAADPAGSYWWERPMRQIETSTDLGLRRTPQPRGFFTALVADNLGRPDHPELILNDSDSVVSLRAQPLSGSHKPPSPRMAGCRPNYGSEILGS